MRVAAALALVLGFARRRCRPAPAGGVTPAHYTLWFAPDLEKETFRGRETIEVTLAAPATSITLHAAEITFGEVTIDGRGRHADARA